MLSNIVGFLNPIVDRIMACLELLERSDRTLQVFLVEVEFVVARIILIRILHMTLSLCLDLLVGYPQKF